MTVMLAGIYSLTASLAGYEDAVLLGLVVEGGQSTTALAMLLPLEQEFFELGVGIH